MSGILFLRTAHLRRLVDFYTGRLGCTLWLDQDDCAILKHGNFLFGFCERETAQAEVMLTFFFETAREVEQAYEQLADQAIAPPARNEKYNIYQFFARDPEGRMLEFQQFLQPVGLYRTGSELLTTRRSVREFEPDPVSDETIHRIVDSCRYAPTGYNYEPHYYHIIRDPDTIRFLAEARGEASAHIGRAPVAVAVCIESDRSEFPVIDGTIATYHFLLAAWDHGLGTCWTGYMDLDEVKARLGIPLEHYIATVSPLGRPRGGVTPPAPARRDLDEFIR